MSDKKTPANPPSAQDASEQEFDRFLRGDETATAASYRKLPVVEPGADLDARVRALALRALRDSPTPTASGESSDDRTSSGETFDRRRRTGSARWLPAFASAAVLVLATGIVWQLGPRNWAGKETTGDVALDAATATNASPSAPETKPDQVAKVAAKASPSDANRAGTAARSSGARERDADAANGPPAFPAQAPATVPVRPGGAAAAPGASRVDDNNPTPETGFSQAMPLTDEASPSAKRPSGSARAAAPLAPAPLAPARERRAGTVSATERVNAPVIEPQPGVRSESTASARIARTAQDHDADGADTLRPPAPDAAPRIAQAPPAPPAPVVSAETTPMPAEAVAQTATTASATSSSAPRASNQASIGTAPRAQSRIDAREQEETSTQGPPRALAGAASQATDSMKARSASAPPAPPPAPPPQAPAAPGSFVSEPPAAPEAVTSKPRSTAALAQNEKEMEKQAYSDHFALPPGSPPAKIPGRPTPAQLAAWPAPNCHASGTVVPNGIGIDTRTWRYPPEVPDTLPRRIAIVKDFLEAESPEGARKAYADFHHCYPEDRWPPPLLRRLGVQ